MSIVSSDIVKRYSVSAGAGDTVGGVAANSLGDQVSTTPITDNAFGNVFPDVTGSEASGGVVKYRCIFILNNHATLTLLNATVAITSQGSGGSSVDVAVDNIAASAKGSASPQAAVIANENIAPSGVGAFGAGPLAIGNLAPGQVRGVWLRQTTASGTTPPGVDGSDQFVLTVAGDSLP
jgi:hypothetical protein